MIRETYRHMRTSKRPQEYPSQRAYRVRPEAWPTLDDLLEVTREERLRTGLQILRGGVKYYGCRDPFDHTVHGELQPTPMPKTPVRPVRPVRPERVPPPAPPVPWEWEAFVASLRAKPAPVPARKHYDDATLCAMIQTTGLLAHPVLPDECQIDVGTWTRIRALHAWMRERLPDDVVLRDWVA
jgi:hypothetical protein